MLKNKLKLLILFFMIFTLLFSSIVFATDSGDSANSTVSESTVMPISTDSGDTIDEQSSASDATSSSDRDVIDSTQVENTDSASSTEDSIYYGDQYLFDQNISVNTNIDGNLFAMGSTVTINSQIAGDAFIFANNVVIETDTAIFGNLVVCANTIDFKGSAYDIYAIGDTLTINQGFTYRDVRAMCTNFNVYGTISRNAFVDCSNINFVNGDVQGMIMGNLEYSAPSEANISEDFVNGTVKFTEKSVTSPSIGSYLLSLGTFLVLVIIVWLVLLWIAPKFKESTENLVKNKKWSILLIGFLSLIVIPIVTIILLLINITTSVALLLLLVYFVLIAISESVFIITVNNFIANKFKINKNIGIFGMLIVTAIVFWALYLIPFNIGSILTFVSVILGLGLIVTPLFYRKNEAITDSKNSK